MIKKLSKLIAALSFMIIFIVGVGSEGINNYNILLISSIKGAVGALIIWFLFSVILDILFKSTLEDIPYDEMDKLEGGLIQQISEHQDNDKVKNVMNNSKDKK